MIDDAVPSTIRALMGPDATVLSLFEFIRQCAPNLQDLASSQDTPDHIRLRNTLVCPLQSMVPTGCRKVECIQSLSSLVDDVVWSLVQRRSRDKTSNVLSQGYVLASDHLLQTQAVRPCPHMRPGVLCTHMNDNVSFCKTSSLTQTLHRLVGDDVLRALLLHTTVFLPVEHDWGHPKQNYVVLCGPPVQATRTSVLGRKRSRATSSSNVENKPRRRRKNNSDESNTESACNECEWDPNASVPRHSLFYSSSFVPKVGLPSTHVLNQRPKNCRALLASMLDCTGNRGRKRWKRVSELGIRVCEQIFRRHSTCDYHRLLNRYCPLPDFCASNGRTQSEDSPPNATLAQVSASHSPSDGVVSFIRAVLRRVFPLEFWGSEHNFNKALSVAETFVKLRRQEQLPNKALMNGVRIKDVLWVYGGMEAPAKNSSAKKQTWSKTLHEAATTRIRNVMRWLFSQYLIPLLRSVFYVTESEFSAKRVLYYRKPVWSIFRSLSMKKLLVRQYSEISSSKAASLLRNQNMGLSRLRLLPKETGVRALATLSKREYANFEKADDGHDVDMEHENMPANKRARLNTDTPREIVKLTSNRRLQLDARFCSTNAILGNVFEVLRHERERQPHLFGAGVFGLNEVYPAYHRFLAKFRQSHAVPGVQTGSPQLYFASVDIKQCYDSINQKHLLDILPQLLSEDDYLIQNYVVMHPFESMGRVLRKKVRRVGPPESYRPFHGAAHVLTREYNRSVFMDGVGCALVRRDEALELLREHLLSHVVVVQGRYGDRFLLQSTGIPQGSVLSTLLCNYYYGHVEKALLGDIASAASNANPPSQESCTAKTDDGHATLLVRIVDDFLLITTNRELSTNFLKTMSAGNDKLGVHINGDKTLVNYNVTIESIGGEAEKLTCTVGGTKGPTLFPWCGMLFDTKSGEVGVDYSRFANGRAADALTIDRSGEEGRQLEIRIKSFVRPRCQPMLFDARINCARVVGINFAQVLLLCAIKTVSYIADGMEGGVDMNPEHIIRSIEDVCLYTYTLIAERLRQAKSDLPLSESSPGPHFRLKQKDAMWLGYDAFRSVFTGARGCGKVAALLSAKCRLNVANDDRRLRDIADAALRQFDAQMGHGLNITL